MAKSEQLARERHGLRARIASMPGVRVRGRRARSGCVVFAAAIAMVWSAAGPAAEATRQVLILQGNDLLSPQRAMIDPALREALSTTSTARVEIATEVLNLSLDTQIADEPPARTRLAQKYGDRRFDLIMPVGLGALDFAQTEAALWPGVPILFYGITDDLLMGRKFDANTGGLTLDADIDGTIALARQLQPEARELIWISGASAYDRRWEQRLLNLLRERDQGLSISGLSGHSLADLEQRLASVPANTIVLYLSMLRDRAGETYVPLDVAERLSRVSRAPIYGVRGTYMGQGIVGGSLPDFATYGREVGTVAAQILNKERSIADVGVAVRHRSCSVDARALQRWDIAMSNVPPACRILFAPPSFLQAHRDTMLLIGALIAIAFALVALGIQHRKRRVAEAEAKRAHEALADTSRLTLVGDLSASIAHDITQPLSAILSNAEVAQLLLDAREPSLPDLREIVSEIRQDDLRANKIVSDVRALLQRRQLRFEPVNVNRLALQVAELVTTEAVKRDIELRVNLSAGLPEVSADPIYLQQMLLSLIVNAMDSLGAAGSGRSVELLGSAQGAAVELKVVASDESSIETQAPIGKAPSVARAIVALHEGTCDTEEAAGKRAWRVTLPVRRASMKPVQSQIASR